ncbi:MAG TPA: hypothetical protein VFT55_17205 [Planctomycetota bacterium]|nr:hypothetical protein [Planctomycetota bacterium]
MSCEPVQFGPGDGEIAFALTVAADAAVGRHRNFLVQVLVPSAPVADGASPAMVEHRFGGGEIRIDEPIAKPVAQSGKEGS